MKNKMLENTTLKFLKDLKNNNHKPPPAKLFPGSQ